MKSLLIGLFLISVAMAGGFLQQSKVKDSTGYERISEIPASTKNEIKSIVHGAMKKEDITFSDASIYLNYISHSEGGTLHFDASVDTMNGGIIDVSASVTEGGDIYESIS